ncbi:MAG: hypothetical protein LBT53_02525 [Puniceicoccales bacterium]|jgi:hypothetical protein|nr:hypothetical protein [Puniceicoccales bacterium]
MKTLRTFRTLRTLALAAAAAFLAGCSSYEQDVAKTIELWSHGDYAGAASLSGDVLKETGSGDRLLWQLENATTLRGAGKFNDSIAAFDAALETVADWDRQPDVSVSSEALAALNNMTSLPYRGTGYDRIMLSTYQALNYLALGRRDNARVALNLALQRQAEAVAANAKRIENSQDEAKAAKRNGENSYDADRALKDDSVKSGLSENYSETRSMRAYADYVNPFSVWLDGIFFLANNRGGSDTERAYKSLQRAASMTSCAAVKEDFALAAKVRAAVGVPSIPPIVYVIHEAGLAPARHEIKINIPVFIVTSKVPFVSAAFPKLEFNKSKNSSLRVWSDAPGAAAPATTETLARMDSVIATDFDNEFPAIVVRTLISTGIKAAIAYGINTASDKATEKKSEGVRLAAFIASRVTTAVYSVATAAADLRTWRTLPKEFQVARITPPKDRVLRIATGGHAAQTVNLLPGTVNVIYVRTTRANTPLAVSQFVLKP